MRMKTKLKRLLACMLAFVFFLFSMPLDTYSVSANEKTDTQSIAVQAETDTQGITPVVYVAGEKLEAGKTLAAGEGTALLTEGEDGTYTLTLDNAEITTGLSVSKNELYELIGVDEKSDDNTKYTYGILSNIPLTIELVGDSSVSSVDVALELIPLLDARTTLQGDNLTLCGSKEAFCFEQKLSEAADNSVTILETALVELYAVTSGEGYELNAESELDIYQNGTLSIDWEGSEPLNFYGKLDAMEDVSGSMKLNSIYSKGVTYLINTEVKNMFEVSGGTTAVIGELVTADFSLTSGTAYAINSADNGTAIRVSQNFNMSDGYIYTTAEAYAVYAAQLDADGALSHCVSVNISGGQIEAIALSDTGTGMFVYGGDVSFTGGYISLMGGRSYAASEKLTEIKGCGALFLESDSVKIAGDCTFAPFGGTGALIYGVDKTTVSGLASVDASYLTAGINVVNGDLSIEGGYIKAESMSDDYIAPLLVENGELKLSSIINIIDGEKNILKTCEYTSGGSTWKYAGSDSTKLTFDGSALVSEDMPSEIYTTSAHEHNYVEEIDEELSTKEIVALRNTCSICGYSNVQYADYEEYTAGKYFEAYEESVEPVVYVAGTKLTRDEALTLSEGTAELTEFDGAYTLTLDNAEITGGAIEGEDKTYGIWSNVPLTIQLVGNSSVSGVDIALMIEPQIKGATMLQGGKLTLCGNEDAFIFGALTSEAAEEYKECILQYILDEDDIDADSLSDDDILEISSRCDEIYENLAGSVTNVTIAFSAQVVLNAADVSDGENSDAMLYAVSEQDMYQYGTLNTASFDTVMGVLTIENFYCEGTTRLKVEEVNVLDTFEISGGEANISGIYVSDTFEMSGGEANISGMLVTNDFNLTSGYFSIYNDAEGGTALRVKENFKVSGGYLYAEAESYGIYVAGMTEDGNDTKCTSVDVYRGYIVSGATGDTGTGMYIYGGAVSFTSDSDSFSVFREMTGGNSCSMTEASTEPQGCGLMISSAESVYFGRGTYSFEGGVGLVLCDVEESTVIDVKTMGVYGTVAGIIARNSGLNFNSGVTYACCNEDTDDECWTPVLVENGELVLSDEMTVTGAGGKAGVQTYEYTAESGTKTWKYIGTDDAVLKYTGLDADGNMAFTSENMAGKIRIRDDHEHSYTRVITTEPTHEADGVVSYTCGDCGDSYEKAVSYDDVYYNRPDTEVDTISGLEEYERNVEPEVYVAGTKLVPGEKLTLDKGTALLTKADGAYTLTLDNAEITGGVIEGKDKTYGILSNVPLTIQLVGDSSVSGVDIALMLELQIKGTTTLQGGTLTLCGDEEAFCFVALSSDALEAYEDIIYEYILNGYTGDVSELSRDDRKWIKSQRSDMFDKLVSSITAVNIADGAQVVLKEAVSAESGEAALNAESSMDIYQHGTLSTASGDVVSGKLAMSGFHNYGKTELKIENIVADDFEMADGSMDILGALEATDATITGGTLNVNNPAADGIGLRVRSVLDMSGGVVNVVGADCGVRVADYVEGNVNDFACESLTVSGGELNASVTNDIGSALFAEEGTIAFTGGKVKLTGGSTYCSTTFSTWYDGCGASFFMPSSIKIENCTIETSGGIGMSVQGSGKFEINEGANLKVQGIKYAFYLRWGDLKISGGTITAECTGDENGSYWSPFLIQSGRLYIADTMTKLYGAKGTSVHTYTFNSDSDDTDESSDSNDWDGSWDDDDDWDWDDDYDWDYDDSEDIVIIGPAYSVSAYSYYSYSYAWKYFGTEETVFRYVDKNADVSDDQLADTDQNMKFISENMPKSIVLSDSHEHSYTEEIITPATAEADGVAQYTCEACGDTYETAVKPMLEGAAASWRKGSKDGVVFRSAADYSTFKAVELDGSVLDSKNYTVTEGSTVVTLNPEYLETLEAGEHTMRIVSTDGSFAETEFTIEKEYEGKIVVLHTNDVHGEILGYAKIAALRKEYEEKGAEVILVDAGDYSQGSSYVSTSKGASAITLMNAAGYDFATLGNHEFDFGTENMLSNLSAAEFKVICADAFDKDNNRLFDGSAIYTTSDGVKIGFFGMATPETQNSANPALLDGVTFSTGEEFYSVAQTEINELRAAGADIVICVGHLGVDEESGAYRSTELYKNVTGLDFIIDGHSHTVMTSGENGEPVQSTGTKVANVGVVVIDSATKAIESNTLVSIDDKSADDDEVLEAANKIKAEVDEELGQVFAKTTVTLNGERNDNRTGETNLGDLICDAMVWQVLKNEGSVTVDKSNVVAINNAGGIRATVKAGDITKQNLIEVLPFGNTVSVIYVKGSALLEALEASTWLMPAALPAFPQVSGIEFSIDTTKEYDANDETYPGSTYYGPKTINRVTITSVNGKPFDENATYAVVTNDFIAAGGDTYYALSSSAVNIDTGIRLDEAVADYITEELNGVVGEQYADTQGRISVVTEAPTEKPTETPTEKPTEAPTEKPTETPTEKPTEAPTEAPTETPTEKPTEKPTEAPTEKPTETPTEKPTETPTEAPTEKPTETPTEKPTETPTTTPTEAPAVTVPDSTTAPAAAAPDSTTLTASSGSSAASDDAQTGDNNMAVIYAMLLLASGAVLTAAAAADKKKKAK